MLSVSCFLEIPDHLKLLDLSELKKVEPTALVALGSPCVTPIGFKPITF